ncbi:hypothetical protein Bhyg_16920 [Pseudolycoriella hygida]|uniref:Uncharacterized protein n=1 Tax=Pseudolycoriella hygida TaxID=35572 RepID=A0A9Q0RUR7_9DIPT|nr:hypothetical protein Bhyg_16920 [Pseudolycoriella hygida]
MEITAISEVPLIYETIHQKPNKNNVLVGGSSCFTCTALLTAGDSKHQIPLIFACQRIQNMAEGGPSSPCRASNRILRCFSGRYDVTEDEVKRFINVSTLVTNEKAKEIFRHFLETHKTSLALQTLKCFELADKMHNDASIRTEDNYDELKELMPAFIWEKRLDDAIEAKNEEILVEYFMRLMDECKRFIETHADFRRYRKTLLNKLKKCTC